MSRTLRTFLLIGCSAFLWAACGEFESALDNGDAWNDDLYLPLAETASDGEADCEGDDCGETSSEEETGPQGPPDVELPEECADSCGNENARVEKFLICHFPDEEEEIEEEGDLEVEVEEEEDFAPRTLCLPERAIIKHLENHGDECGECEQETLEGSEPEPPPEA